MNRRNLKLIINNLIKNIKLMISKNPKKTKKILVTLVIIILIITLTAILIKEKDKQKYVEYTGKNLSESKYPG